MKFVSPWTVHECTVHDWLGQIVRLGKKKKKKENAAQDSAENAESKRALHIITKKKRKFVFGKGSLPLEFLEFGGCYPQNLLIVLFKKMVSSKLG